MKTVGCDVMTVDVEDWHSATYLQRWGDVVDPTPEVLESGLRLLDYFQTHGICATWFMLGEVAEHFPELPRRIAAAGHELGIHGYHHHPIHALSPDAFRESLRRAKSVVEDASGTGVIGYRAVDFSLGRTTWYALDILLESGFLYDSSIFPFAGPRYGIADASPFPGPVRTSAGRTIFELPMTVASAGGRTIPGGGGGYLRHFPLAITRCVLRRARTAGVPIVFYLHPSEVEPNPRRRLVPEGLSAAASLAFKFYTWTQTRNRAATLGKLSALCREHRFDSVRGVFAAELGLAA
jgi:polysaccharide deacetylase family protein (PEP-CTERM system associated)